MMLRRRLAATLGLVLLSSRPGLAQWNPNNPIDSAPAKEKIPAYVRHATYTALKAPVAGPIEVGYNYHLPPGYDASTERYPVIYQLGGHTDNESIGLVDRGLPNRYQEKMEDGSIRPVISIYVNGPGTLESYTLLQPTIIEELMPHVDASFRTLTSAACRHIEGYSRGGSGAPLFAFDDPDLFLATVSNAGSGTEGITDALPSLKQAALGAGMRLRVTILEGDHLFEANQEFRQFLDAQAIPYDYASAPGGSHDTNKYFNDPATYEPIGYGNIIWHEKAFAEQGCDQPSGTAGNGGAGGMGGFGGLAGSGGMTVGISGIAGQNSPDGGGRAGNSGAAETAGVGPGGGGASAAAAPMPGQSPVAEGGCACRMGASRTGASLSWSLAALALAGIRRRGRRSSSSS